MSDTKNISAIAPDSYKLAFEDPEFLNRRETRGIRLQLEMMKADLGQHEHGVSKTVVVFGSARFKSHEVASELLTKANAMGDAAHIATAELALRNSAHYEAARTFGSMVAQGCAHLPGAW